MGLAMTDLTPREILGAIQRGMEETWRKIDRGELRQDGRLDWSGYAGAGEQVTHMEQKPAINDMTPREILVSRALDTVARRFAEQKADQMSGRTSRQPIE